VGSFRRCGSKLALCRCRGGRCDKANGGAKTLSAPEWCSKGTTRCSYLCLFSLVLIRVHPRLLSRGRAVRLRAILVGVRINQICSYQEGWNELLSLLAGNGAKRSMIRVPLYLLAAFTSGLNSGVLFVSVAPPVVRALEAVALVGSLLLVVSALIGSTDPAPASRITVTGLLLAWSYYGVALGAAACNMVLHGSNYRFVAFGSPILLAGAAIYTVAERRHRSRLDRLYVTNIPKSSVGAALLIVILRLHVTRPTKSTWLKDLYRSTFSNLNKR
jgi:hypothetical protein